MAKGPLNGVRILDLTHVWAGPLATRILADLGAEVVKIEAPMGRGPRQFPRAMPIGGFIGGKPGPEPYNTNAVFVKLQRNKKSVALNLKTEPGRDAFLQLVQVSDVVIENFSARAMSRLGLNYAELRKANSKIIHVAMPGYGLTGAYRDRVAFGPTVEPMSGLPFAMGYSDTEPRATAMAVPDPIAAVNATAAVMTALRHRKATGRGCQVEMSLHEAAVSYSGPWLIDTQLGNQVKRYANRHPEIAPHGVYRCGGKDNWIALACVDESSWTRLASLIDIDGAHWDLNDRLLNHDAIDQSLISFTESRDTDDVLASLQSIGVAAGPVYDTQQMSDNPQSIERGFFVPLEQGTLMPGNPVKMSGISSEDWTPCPKLGTDNEEILREWLDFDDSQIEDLYERQVLVNQPPR